jgi:hypothetical protein
MQLGDLPACVDFDCTATVDVPMELALANDATWRWKAISELDPGGYRIVWRETMKGVAKYKMILGVMAVEKDGNA